MILRANSFSSNLRWLIFIGLLAVQITFFQHTHRILPSMDVVPDVPSATTAKALSFGDEQALFRLYALRLQNAGDTFGRFTALYQYDFNRLYHWFMLMDTLDSTSDFVPSMASYYFSQSQNTPDIAYMVDYLQAHTQGRAKEKWWWIVQGVYLANHKLKDSARALKLAKQVEGVEGIPIWVQQLPAFMHEQRGEFDDALMIIQNIIASKESFTQGELNFMNQFAAERLGKLEEAEAMMKNIDKNRVIPKQNVPGITGEGEGVYLP